MKTDDLIEALSIDATSPQPSMTRTWLGALSAGALGSALLMVFTLKLRPDFLEALRTVRFDLKFVITLWLAIPACLLARRLADPVGRNSAGLLAIAPALLVMAVLAELAVLPHDLWLGALVGTNTYWCLGFIPIFSLPVLAALFVALRRGAPIRARLTGLMAGLAAGGFGATVYAAHCTDDSPLFVATWYTIGIAVTAALGAALGPRLLRW